MIELLDYVDGPKSHTSGGQLFIGMLIAYWLHRYFLLGERPNVALRERWGSGYGGFFLVTLLFAAALVAVVLLLSNYLPPDMSHVDRDVRRLFYLFLTLPIYLILLSLFGSALPAAAVRDSFGLVTTLGRVRKTFLPTFFGMLAGPFLFVVVASVAVGYGLHRLGVADDARLPSGAISFPGLAASIFFRFVGMVTTTLAVAVLCRAYRRVVPGPATSESSSVPAA